MPLSRSESHARRHFRRHADECDQAMLKLLSKPHMICGFQLASNDKHAPKKP